MYFHNTMAFLSNLTLSFPAVAYSLLPAKVANTLHIAFDSFVSSLFVLIGGFLPSIRSKLPASPTHLSGRTAIVTGGNSGIGLQIVLDLTRLGAEVVLASRSTERAEQAKQEIIREVSGSAGRVHIQKLDTSSQASVREFARRWHAEPLLRQKIDILVHNAGIGSIPKSASEFSEDDFELTYATNFLGSFLLTHLLEGSLSDDARIIFTSSTGQYLGKISKNFSIESVKNKVEPGFHAAGRRALDADRYGMTKCMQCALARNLQLRFERQAAASGTQNRKIAHSFSPGYTVTPIFGKLELKSFWADPEFAFLKACTWLATPVSEGAATGSWLASTNEQQVIGPGKGGRYWDRCVRRKSAADMLDEDTLNRLWLRWEADAGVNWR